MYINLEYYEERVPTYYMNMETQLTQLNVINLFYSYLYLLRIVYLRRY